jgi:hypothetical protein
MVDLNAHEAGNSGQGQGKPTARGVLLYSDKPRRSLRATAPVLDPTSLYRRFRRNDPVSCSFDDGTRSSQMVTMMIGWGWIAVHSLRKGIKSASILG